MPEGAGGRGRDALPASPDPPSRVSIERRAGAPAATPTRDAGGPPAGGPSSDPWWAPRPSDPQRPSRGLMDPHCRRVPRGTAPRLHVQPAPRGAAASRGPRADSAAPHAPAGPEPDPARSLASGPGRRLRAGLRRLGFSAAARQTRGRPGRGAASRGRRVHLLAARGRRRAPCVLRGPGVVCRVSSRAFGGRCCVSREGEGGGGRGWGWGQGRASRAATLTASRPA